MTTSVLWWSSTADYMIWSPLYLVIIEASWTLFYLQCDEGLKSGIYLCFLCIFWQSKYCEFNSNCKIFLQLNEKSFWIFLCMNKSILKYSVEWRYCGRLPFKEGHGKSDKTNSPNIRRKGCKCLFLFWTFLWTATIARKEWESAHGQIPLYLPRTKDILIGNPPSWYNIKEKTYPWSRSITFTER